MWFFMFVLSVAINCSFTIYFALYCVMIEGFTLLYMLGLLEAIAFCGLGWILTCTSVNIDVSRSLPIRPVCAKHVVSLLSRYYTPA